MSNTTPAIESRVADLATYIQVIVQAGGFTPVETTEAMLTMLVASIGVFVGHRKAR